MGPQVGPALFVAYKTVSAQLQSSGPLWPALLGQRPAGIGFRVVCSASLQKALSTELTLACCYCPSFYQRMPWGFRVLEQGEFEALNKERDWEQKTQKGLLGFSFL